MKVYIKNKLVSFGGSSKVLDESQNPIYKVKGKLFSITHKKKIYDMQGKLLYRVRNKWINFFTHKAYIYDAKKKKIATVRDKWANVNQEYFIQDYVDEIKIEGKFLSTNCNILRNGEKIGNINRQFFAITDSFELEANEEDIPFLIALVIAIDNIVDHKTK
ncbi:MAG: LURP-one-related/scramblase family protein [Anaeroplasmataceae bacterium]